MSIQLYTNGKKIYSVDMIKTYISNNKKKIKIYKEETELYEFDLNIKMWYANPKKKTKIISLNDVLRNPKISKFHYDKIINSNEKEPIILRLIDVFHDIEIVDGFHRIAKAKLLGLKYIKWCVIGEPIIHKSLVDKNGNYGKVYNMPLHEFLELYKKRFG